MGCLVAAGQRGMWRASESPPRKVAREEMGTECKERVVKRGVHRAVSMGPRGTQALQEPCLGVDLSASTHRWGGGLAGLTRADAAGEGVEVKDGPLPGPPALPCSVLMPSPLLSHPRVGHSVFSVWPAVPGCAREHRPLQRWPPSQPSCQALTNS